jgi:hypothetical protein
LCQTIPRLGLESRTYESQYYYCCYYAAAAAAAAAAATTTTIAAAAAVTFTITVNFFFGVWIVNWPFHICEE